MKNIGITTPLLFGALFSHSVIANNEDQPVVQSLDVYQNGLIATVYSEQSKSGSWASSKPVGIPIGEFVDSKSPAFSFANLKQDDAAWSIYSGTHVGIEWSGYLFAEETGNYVLMLDLVKKDGTRYHANSCVSDLSLSGSSVLRNEFKWKHENYYIDNDRYQQTKANSVNLESGYYPLKLWLHCGVTTEKWDSWVNNADDATWTLKIKRPSDRIVQAAPTGTLVWK